MRKLLLSALMLPLALATACDPNAGEGEGEGEGEGVCDPNPDDESCADIEESRPPALSEIQGIYDKGNDRMIIFGGSTAVPVNCGFPTPTFQETAFAFYPACGKWEQLGATGPNGRVRHMMTYDEANERMLVFGGRFRLGTVGNYTNFNDVWELDLTTDTWTELGATSIDTPQPRVNSGWVVNNDGSKAYMFGGNVSLSGLSYAPRNDLWEFDLSTQAWTELTPAGGPPDRRLFVASLWDPVRERFVITGGADESAFDNDAQYFNDVWAYTPGDNTWELLHDGGGTIGDTVPAGRFWGEWIYDEGNDNYRLFAGHDDQALGNSNDMWTFDPDGNVWTLVDIGDTQNAPSNGFCDFPPDFTNVALFVPERRNAHALVYSSYEPCPGIIVSMGKTDCGVTDDVQRFNLNEGAWQELVTARQGEACLRRDSAFDCQDMCF
jgi:hypothetical protein